MCSAIPVALLCMNVSVSEREQGSGPKGDEVLQNTGGLSFVQPERAERANARTKVPCVLQDFVPFGAAAQKGLLKH